MVPAGHQIILSTEKTTLRKPGSMTFESAECGKR
jgi:hypothetical protein